MEYYEWIIICRIEKKTFHNINYLSSWVQRDGGIEDHIILYISNLGADLYYTGVEF